MRIVINAGHTKLGGGTGATGYLNESVETRKIAYELMKLLADTKHEVIPAVYDRSSNNLIEAVTLANNKGADLFISIHLNAGKGRGSEVYTYKGKRLGQAAKALENLNKLGFLNRGVKDGSNFYVIKHTKMPCILIEVCFVDTKSDVDLYKKVGSKGVANAIYNSIL